MDTTFDPALESDIKELMKEVPPPIRAVFASGKVETVAKNLMQKNQLHIDQGAVMEREIILLLLGLKSPDEFTKALIEEARLNQQTINGITKDMNDQIFVPLREEMRRGPAPQASARPAIQIPKPAAAQPPRPVAPPQVRQTAHMAGNEPLSSQPESYFHLQNKLPPPAVVQPPRPMTPPPPVPPASSFKPPASRFAPLPPKLGAPVRESQTFTESRKLLADHEEPHIDISDKVRVVSRPPAEPPPNLPGAMPPIEPTSAPVTQPPAVQPPPSPPMSSTPPAPPSPSKPVPPAPKSYSVDPYREPIDEK